MPVPFAESKVAKETDHVSAVPAIADLVGLIKVGTCEVQLDPLIAEQPIRIVTDVPPEIDEDELLQVIVGVLPAEKELREQLRFPILLLIFAEVKPFGINVVADGDAWLVSLEVELGNVMMILPVLGMAVAVWKLMVCIAVMGVAITVPFA